MRWCRGGNASNACTTLTRLLDTCPAAVPTSSVEFLGAVGDDLAGRFLKEDMTRRKIRFDNCLRTPEGCATPISSIMLNGLNGSRTILHYSNEFPELQVTDFMLAVS